MNEYLTNNKLKWTDNTLFYLGKKIYPTVEVVEIAYPKDNRKYELLIRYSRRSKKDRKKYVFSRHWNEEDNVHYDNLCKMITPTCIRLRDAMNEVS